MNTKMRWILTVTFLALCTVALAAVLAQRTGQTAPSTRTPTPSAENPKNQSGQVVVSPTAGSPADQADQTTVVVSIPKTVYESNADRLVDIEAVRTINYGYYVCLELTSPDFEVLRAAGVEFELLQRVAVRLSKEAYERVAHIETVHTTEYDTFVWLELTSSNFKKLHATGVEFDLECDATVLLFGYRQYVFDPLVEEPPLPAELTSDYAAGTPGLYLVQFFGPSKDEWFANLEAKGVEFLSPSSGDSYLVRMTPRQANEVEKSDFVRWVGPYHPAYRISPELLEYSGTIENVRVTIYDDGQTGGTADRTIEAIEALGGTSVDRYRSSVFPEATAIFALPASAVTSVGQLNDVIYLEYEMTEPIPLDEMSNQIIAGNPLTPGYRRWLTVDAGVSGAGVTVAVIDTGYDTGVDVPGTPNTVHPDVSGRVIMVADNSGAPPVDNDPGNSGHGTHVGGIIAANATVTDAVTGKPVTDTSDFRMGLGVAPDVELVVRYFSDSHFDKQGDAVTNGAVASNNSYTVHGASAGYRGGDRDIDELVRDSEPTNGDVADPLIIVFAAGNCGAGGPGSPCFGNTGPTTEAKNVIAVGATQNQRDFWGGPGVGNIDNIWGSSSRGPAQDDRVYPHVVAPGDNIISTRSSVCVDPGGGRRSCSNRAVGAPAADPTYSCTSGTSMAAPHVTGAVALITEWWRGLTGGTDPSPAMAKALLVNGAVDIDLADIPNGDEGWGRINLSNVLAAGVPTEYYDQPITFVQDDEVHAFCFDVADVNQPVKVTLAWTDAPGRVNQPALVNDLDLSVVLTATGDVYFGAGGGTTANFFNGFSQVGGNPDRVDNLENVYINVPAGGFQPGDRFRVVVRAFDIVGDGVPYNGYGTDQDFALVVRNAISPDSDCDGIPDSVENSFGIDDPDGDSIPNHLDLDSDGDTITDTTEAGLDPWHPLDTDSLIPEVASVSPPDGIPDFLDTDSDNDSILDSFEAGDDDPDTEPINTDDDVLPDYRDIESDGDFILDMHEAGDDNPDTPPVNTDSLILLAIKDEIPDYLDDDSDGDTIPDWLEAGDEDPLTEPWDSDRDGTYDFQSWDSDGNGLPDRVEVDSLDPFPDPENPRDTDSNGVFDFQDLDNDGDRIPDTVEIRQEPAAWEWDSDSDGIPDHLELDSDDDTIPDRIEAGSNPRDPVNHDTDDLPDYRDLDSDDDTIPDAGEWSTGPGDLLAGCTTRAPVCLANDAEGDGEFNYFDLDSDDDTFADAIELTSDNDRDGIPNYLDPYSGIVVEPGTGACPPVVFDIEVCGGSILADYYIQVYDLNTGELVLDHVPIETRPLGCVTKHLFVVKPGYSVNYRVKLVERLFGIPTTMMTRDVKFTNDCMGGDHMDDNLSASSYTLHFNLDQPPGIREQARVAVLSSGFFWATEDLAHLTGEPTQWINLDFDPVATAEQYPVLLIPSGGLYGMENSASFRARLEAYTRRGGVIVAFDQQHGYEYSALPGGEVGGYGWSEDVSCAGASLMMETWHPALSGFSRANVYAHVDGYFDSWPDETLVLLSRRANGRPAAILYPYGAGWVFATTMYDDWGAGHGQSYGDARVLLRDLLTWAITPQDLPEYAPGESVALDIPIANTTATTATAVSLRLVDPTRQLVLTHTVPITIAAGDTVSVPFTTDAVAPRGLWRIDASLQDAAGFRLLADDQVAAYAVARPPAIVDPNRPLYLSITAPDDTFVQGSMATFTYHVYNYGTEALTATVHYGFNHDFDWRGRYRVLAEDVVVPAAQGETPGEVAIPLDVQIEGRFMLRGHVIAGSHRTYAAFGVWASSPSAWLDVSVAPAEVQRSDAGTLTTRVTPARVRVRRNSGSYFMQIGAFTGTLHVRALDATRTFYHTATLPVAAVGTSVAVTHPITVPATAAAGTGQVWIEAHALDGRVVGGGRVYLSVPASPLAFSLLPPPPLVGESTVYQGLVVSDTSPSLPVARGVVTLTLATPGGAITPTTSTTFTLSPLASRSLNLPLELPPLSFGDYTLKARVSDEYGGQWRQDVSWTLRPLVEGAVDAPMYRAGETADLDLRLSNPSPFVLPLTTTLSSPTIPYSHVQALTLQPYGSFTDTLDVPVPPEVLAGGHPISLTLTLPDGDALSQKLATVQVPPSALVRTFDVPPVATPSQVVSITVANVGGARTWGTYELALHDAEWRTVLEAAGSLATLGPDGSQLVSATVPAGVVSGQYYLLCWTDDAQAGEVRSSGQPLHIAGVETLLEAYTDREAYPTDETITVTADLTNTGTPLPDGKLDLRIVRRQGGYWPLWDVYNEDNSGLWSNWVESIAVDREGNVWFGQRYYGEGSARPVGLASPRLQSARNVHVLSADLETWDTVDLPLYPSSVADIFVDAHNRKWFATDDGAALLSADNTTWEIYGSGAGLASDWVNSVAVDGADNAWFGTEEGVSKRASNGEWETFTTDNSGLVSNYVYAVAVDGAGTAWFGTDSGLNRLTTGGEWFTYTMETSDLLSNYVYDIAFDSRGNAWLATPGDDGGVSVLLAAGGWKTYTPYDSGLSGEWSVSAVAMDAAGRTWIGHSGYGVDVLLADGFTWKHYEADDGDELSSNAVNDVATAPNGDVWLATEPYDYYYDSEGGATRAYTGDPWPLWEVYDTDNSGLTSDDVASVAVDSEGNVWFGDIGYYYGEGGSGRTDVLWAGSRTWSTFELPLDSVSRISDIFVDGYNRKWFATDGGAAMLSADNTTWEAYESGDGLASEWVNSVAVDGAGDAWFGTAEGVSKRASGGGWESFTADNSGLVSNYVYAVAVDGAGDAWFGTDGGLNRLTAGGDWFTYTMETSGLLSDYVVAIAFDGAGNVWLATPGDEGGVSVLLADGNWETYTPYDSELWSEWVIAVAVDAAGHTWIGHEGDGVDVVLADGVTWEHYDREDSLSSNIVNDVAAAANGDVWLATEREYGDDGGVTRVYTADPWPAWSVYHTDNSGLVSNWLQSLALDRDGNVWFGFNDVFSHGWGGRTAGLASAIRQEGYVWPDTIEMLSVELGTWHTFELPLPDIPSGVSDIAVDAYNRKWFATDEGVARLSADNTTWDTYTADDSGLVSDWVNSVAVDGDGNAWFGTEGGANKLTPAGEWITYTADNSGLLSDEIRVVAVDDAGNAWFGTDYGLHKLLPNGEWVTYTADSGLLYGYVEDIAFDAAGNVWLAVRGGGISVLLSDDSWMNYTPYDSGLFDDWVTAIAVDAADRKWIGYGGAGVDILLADGITWKHYAAEANGGVLSSDAINDIALAPNGDVWLATEPYDYYDDEGGATRAYDGGFSGEAALWTREVALSLGSPDVFSDVSSVAAYSLGATGKLYLEATLTAPTGQQVAYDEYPFYVFPGDIVLKLDADPRLCRPGHTIALAGEVRNVGVVTLTNRTLALFQEGVLIHTVGPFDLPPGGSVSFATSAEAPAEVGSTQFRANVGGVEVVEVVQVAEPDVTADLEVPSLAGSEPFSFTVSLANSGRIDAAVELTVEASDPQISEFQSALTLPAGEVRMRQQSYQISRDTVFTVTFSGDLASTLVHGVAFGEAVEATFSPEPAYPEGAIAIPYSLANTGQLPILFTTAVTLTDAGLGAWDLGFETYLPAGESSAGNLLLDLPVGDYTLAYATPFDGGVETFRVAAAEAAELSATVGPREGSIIPISASVTNTGFQAIEGALRLETSFFSVDHPVSVPTAQARSYELVLDTVAAEAGAYTATVTLLSGSGLPLASSGVSVAVPGAELVLTSVPSDTLVQAGELVTLTFGVANQGSAPATAVISVTLGNFVDEAQSLWLPGGESGALDFAFLAPDGLAEGSLVGEYWFEGQRYDLSLPIAGVDLDVEAGWDQALYAPAETATLQVTVTNQAAISTPLLYAHVAYGGEVITQPLALSAEETGVLDFALTADGEADPKVFYAVFELAEERGIYLDTTYLYVRNPDVTIVPQRHVYQPGETVQATVYATVSGTLAISAPGFTTTLALAGEDTGFQFTLPADLMRGTYTIDYALDGGPPRSTPFDVDAVWVRVTEARLEGLPYEPGDVVQADLTVASTHALDVGVETWLLHPDGTRSARATHLASLQDVLNNHVILTLPLSTTQAGPHRLVYVFTVAGDPERVYAAGSETFDVGTVVVLGLHTERETYPYTTDPVTATLTLYARVAAEAGVALSLDGTPIASHTLALTTGVQTVDVTVPGPMSPAWHDLTTRVVADGLSHAAHTAFGYGTDVVDLVATAPQLIAGSGPTRTLRARVYNSGKTPSTATMVQIWDGDPSAGGALIDTQPLPALSPGAGAQVELVWSVLGQAGEHTLVVVADPDGLVAEFYPQNNCAAADVTLPPFDLAVESGAAAYDEGDPAVLTLRATNLTTAPAVLVVTTTAESLSQQVVFTDVRTLDLPAATQVGEDVVWDTSWVPNGTYAIHAEGDGGLSSQMLYVSVSNVPPTVDAGPDQTADEGAEVVFDGSFSDPGLLDTHTVAWDFGDSATAGGTLTPTHAFADDGLYTVTLTVTDDDGGVGSDTLVVSVNNLPPTVDAGPDQTADEGDEVAFAGSFSDPGLLDTHTVAWDFGDSETAGGTLTPTHTYGDDGLYTVTLTVTDDDGGEDSSTLLVTVSNVAPLVNAGPDQTADEGDEVVFSGSFTDPGTADTHSVAWDFGDGITTTGTLTPTHAYADDGVYTATLTVTDDGGGEDSSTLLVTVSNVAPVVSAGPNRTVDEGDALTLVGSFSDPGTADTHTVAWSLGDGSSVSDQLTVTHVYTALGIYTATLTVTDDDGGVGTDEVRVTVREPVTGTPSTDVGDYAILGLNSVWMQWDSDLHSGHVGVQNASPGPVLDPDGTWVAMERIPGCRWGRWWHCWRWRFYKAEVSIGHGVTFHDPASAIGGDTVRLRQRADVFDVYCNEFKADPGATYGQVHTPLSLPLVTNLPALPEITPGSTDYVLGWQKSLELPSGAYGDIWLGGRSVLTLTGGVYHFANLQAGYESRIVVTAPTEVRIAGRLGTSMNVVVGPAPGSGLDASDLIVFVAGTDGCPGGRPCFFPKSATIGYQNRIAANIYAPNGTLWLMSRTEATGAFIGRNVQVGSSTQVWLKSGFADESPSP